MLYIFPVGLGVFFVLDNLVRMGYGFRECWCAKYQCNGKSLHKKAAWRHQQEDKANRELYEDFVDGQVEDWDDHHDNDNDNDDNDDTDDNDDNDDNDEDEQPDLQSDEDTTSEEEDEEKDDANNNPASKLLSLTVYSSVLSFYLTFYRLF